MTKNAVIPANWVSVCGFEIKEEPVLDDNGNQKYDDAGNPKFRRVAHKLNIAPKVFRKEAAEKLIEAYKAKGVDLDDTRIVIGKNAQNSSTLGPFIRNLAKKSEEQGYLTTSDFTNAADKGKLSGLTPSASNKIYTAIVRQLMKNGCFVEASRGPTSDVLENEVDLEDLDLFA